MQNVHSIKHEFCRNNPTSIMYSHELSVEQDDMYAIIFSMELLDTCNCAHDRCTIGNRFPRRKLGILYTIYCLLH